MKVLFHLAHPAHFHLFKNIIQGLIDHGIKPLITYNEKDVLESLIKGSAFSKISLKLKAKKNITSKRDLLVQFCEKNISLYKILKKEKPQLVIGTSIIISLASFPLRIRNVIVNEDDFDIIKQTANLGYIFATKIVCPTVCRTGKWDSKCIKHNSLHELSYLHPDHFTPSKKIVEKYINKDKPYFIIRFAKLSAHHDKGINGISDDFAIQLIEKLELKGSVLITSERDMGETLNKYKMFIDPSDIHHMLAYAQIYIGDSQTMAAEAGVLGTPFIRINDFVDRISYLNDLEKHYSLGWGLKPHQKNGAFDLIDNLFENKSIKKEWKKKTQNLFLEKINFSKFMINHILNEFNN